jgi:preprotein translocase subunit YajC
MVRIIIIFVSLIALSMVLILLFSKKQKPWNEMTDNEKRNKKILIASGTTVFLAGLIASLLLRKKK